MSTTLNALQLPNTSGRALYRLAILTLLTAGGSVLAGNAAAASSTTPLLQDSGDPDTTKSMGPITGTEIKCENGKAKTFECKNVALLSYLPAEAIGGTTKKNLGKLVVIINDMWGWTDPASGREFALVGRIDATAFIEVTDPINPKYLGELRLHDGAKASYWRDIKVYKNHAFIVADAAGPHGMQVFDLTQLLDVKNAPAVFPETAHYDSVGSVHNIIIDTTSGFAYTTSGGKPCGGGMQIIDIRTPANPVFAGCSTMKGHDAQCVTYHGPDQDYQNREICFHASGGLGIIDVTDKNRPKTITKASYPNIRFAHQGWLTDDHRYFLLGDESDEGGGRGTRTIVFDLNNLDDPLVVKEYFGETEAIDHNLYIRGNYAYEANYKAGLRILDISDPVNPKEIGYFDTTPNAENNARYGGAWSDYPFFKNGVIGISSISEGFFLVRFKPSAEGS